MKPNWMALVLVVCVRLFAQEESVERGEDGSFVPNGGFENGLEGWAKNPAGCEIDTTIFHSGKASLKCSKTDEEAFAGVVRTVFLNQKSRKPIIITGWSKAENVSGTSNADYAVRCAVEYTADTRAEKADVWGQCAEFKTGTHDWEYAEHVFIPDHPIKWVKIYAIFRKPHAGTVWFDDIAIKEAENIPFWRDEESSEALAPKEDMKRYRLATEGMSVRIAEDGCVTDLRIGKSDVTDDCARRRSGWGLKHGAGLYVGDFFDGRFWPVSGNCVQTEHGVKQSSRIEDVSLEVEATYRTKGKALIVEGWVKDLKGSDRAIDIVFKLPINIEGWIWWDDITHSKKVETGKAYRRDNFPIACATPPDSSHGISLVIPPMMNAVYTIGYDQRTALFHVRVPYAIVRDIKEHLRGKVPFAFAFYPVRTDWGFRDALKAYYDLFPEAFVRRAKEEGQWLFAINTTKLLNPWDYAYHEGGISTWTRNDDADRKCDAKYGIKMYPYRIPGQRSLVNLKELPVDDEGAVELLDTYEPKRETGWGSEESVKEIRNCAVTKKDGSCYIVRRDHPGTIWPQKKLYYNVVFSVNPDPDLFSDTDKKTVGREELRWIEETFKQYPDLGGVYIDSAAGWVGSWGRKNYRREHFRYADIPLIYDLTDGTPVQMGRFAYIELVQKMASILHPKGYCIFPNIGLGTRHHLLYFNTDVIGIENGRLDDRSMNYYRMASYQKPVLLLHFLEVPGHKLPPDTKEGMEEYWHKSVLYGTYPSIKGHGNGANVAYERYGYLYKKLMPIIRELSANGWEPVTFARCTPDTIRIERFGNARKNKVFFSLYNPEGTSARVAVSIKPELIGQERIKGLTEMIGKTPLGETLPVALTIPGLDVRVIRVDLE